MCTPEGRASEAYRPQPWRFGDGPNQFYADEYAEASTRLDYDLGYDESRFNQYKAEFLADLAAHDAAVRAGALRMAANTLYDDDRANGRHGHPPSLAGWLRDLADRIERGEQS